MQVNYSSLWQFLSSTEGCLSACTSVACNEVLQGSAPSNANTAPVQAQTSQFSETAEGNAFLVLQNRRDSVLLCEAA